MSVIREDAVKGFFQNSMPRLDKGKDAVNSGHLMECKIERTLGVLFGIVQVSPKKKSYNVKVSPVGSANWIFFVASPLIS